MNHPIIIRTQRLNIYPLSDQEMELCIHKESDSDMILAYSEMLEGCRQHPESRIWYAIWNLQLNHQTNISVGDLSFKGMDSQGMVEIGYGVKREYEGQGYMTEAVTAMAKWAIQQPGVVRVEAESDPDHLASHRVLEKSGFRLNGIMGLEGPRFTYHMDQLEDMEESDSEVLTTGSEGVDVGTI